MRKLFLTVFLVLLAAWAYAQNPFGVIQGGGTTLTDNSVTSAHIADNVVGPQDIKAAGAPDNTMYPRYKSATEFQWVTPAGTGDVVGPASATDGYFALFDSTTGKLLKDGFSSVNPSFSTINVTGANALNVGTAGTNAGSIRYKSAGSAVNYFPIIANGTFTDNVGWTLPATGNSGGANYLLNVDADGTMGYTDPATLGGGTYIPVPVATDNGGTGQDSSSSTGFPYVLSGTWSFDNLATILGRLGLSSTDNVTFNKVTSGSFVSNAADNTHLINLGNTADPAAPVDGDCQYNKTSNMWRCYDGSAWTEVFTSGASHTLNFATTGTLTGGIMILDNVVNPTAAQVYGSWNTITTAGTVTLPAVAAGMSTCIATEGALEITLELDGSDTFVLAGVTMDAGEAIINTTAEAAGDYICVIGTSGSKWRVAGKQGTWTQATP